MSSAALYLALEEPAPVWHGAPRQSPPPRELPLLRAVEELWPATVARIAERLHLAPAEAERELAAAEAAGLVARHRTNYHATEAGLALLAGT